MTSSVDSLPTAINLLERASLRDGLAWQQLVELYAPLVRKWCAASRLDPHTQADTMQEVFKSVWQKLPTVNWVAGNSSFRGWLWTITRHKIIDAYRNFERQFAPRGGSSALANLGQIPSPLDELSDFESEPTSAHDLHALRMRAIKQVQTEFEPLTWDAFWRSVVDGLPTEVVALELKTTAANVRQARSRVLRKLRGQLGDLG